MFDDHDGLEPQFKADDCNGDDMNDGHADDNDGTDVLCALCDDGGKLLSCIGRCKRSFHPMKEDGKESKCRTLGYTSKELKGIGSYLCKNCKYKKHQCFECGGLESSDGPDAKVFRCKDSSCVHFYHPKCVAKLLEPGGSDGDENCELAKRIMAGMPFTCPVHWCFECGRMEDRTQKALQFAVCRRCPKSYHRECLPRGISFGTKDKQVEQRAWELSNIIMIYCLDHKICKATGNARRDHIKFPIMPKISKVSNVCKKEVKPVRKRKRIGQCSMKPIMASHRLSSEENEHTKKAAADSSFERTVLKPENPAMSLKKDLEIEPYVVGAAGPSIIEASKGQGKHTRMQPCAVGGKTGKRKTSRPQKRSTSRPLSNVSKKCIVPSSKGMLSHSVQEILSKRPSLDKHAGLEDEIHKIPEDKDGNKKEKTSEHYSQGDATNKVTSHDHENEQNDVPRKLIVDKHDEGHRSKLNSREERIVVWGENLDGCKLVSGQEGDIYMRENQLRQMQNRQDSNSEGKIFRNDSTTYIRGNDGMTPNHVDVLPEKQLIVRHVHRTTDRIDSQPGSYCDEGDLLDQDNACQEEPKSYQCNDNCKGTYVGVSDNQSSKIRKLKKNATDADSMELEKNIRCIGDGPAAYYCDTNHQYPLNLKELDYLDHCYRNNGDNNLCCHDENRVAETFGCKTRQATGSSRKEHFTCSTKENSSTSPMGRNAQKKPMNYSTEGPGSFCNLYDKNLGNKNQYRYEHQWQVNYSSNHNYDSNRWGNTNTQSTLPPAGFGAERWHGPFSYPRGPEHGITGWQSPPFHLTSPGYFPSRWPSPPIYPRRGEHADYTTYQNNLSGVNHGGYHAMGIDPASRYFPRVNNNGTYQPHLCVGVRGDMTANGGSTCDYGLRSNYAFGWGARTPSSVPVTDRYAPRLEETNYQSRGWAMF